MSTTLASLNWAHPLVRDWFFAKFGTPTDPQLQGWPHIAADKITLIAAPTGSGKTFAAFLVAIDRLVRKALAGNLTDQTEILYVSPLKALSNDIQINLTEPLAEILALAKQRNLTMTEIRVAVRTGDTPASERQSMLKKPPHILVTTPESLYILLTAEKSRVMLSCVKTVIVDEIHAMVNSKRGTHLSLSLERLESLTQRPLVRIGLSATQKPIAIVSQFLMGNRETKPIIINIGYAKHLDVALEVPRTELGAVASNQMWDEIYDRIAELTKENRSTLIFVNTRRLAERVAHHLAERLGEEKVATHHGSLSRKLRLTAETRLKNGELQALVATASLELGIDIGSVDLVCQLGSPRAIAVALQRIGRAGHWRGAIAKGRLFATTRDELVECAALIHAIRNEDLDQLIIPREPLDILMQQIVAICATDDWLEDDLFLLIKKAFSYKDLSRDIFNSLLVILSEGIAGSRGRYGTYLFRDQINGVVKARRNARLTAIMNGGAIPDNGLFTVICEPNNVMVGTLDEDFAVESNRGDIILLGTTSWKVNRIESAAGRVIVEDAHGAPPSVPFWRGEAPARTMELSHYVAALRQKISELLPDEQKENATQWLITNCKVNEYAATQLIDYILQGRAILGAVPSQQTIIAERFFDESGGMQLIIHSPFGSRINKAWGLALRKKFCRSFNFELQAAATEDGINISLTEQHSFPLADVFHFLHPNTIKDVLIQAVLQSPLFTTRWRWDATRALALIRIRNGKKVPPNIQRMLADDLLAAVFPDAAACQDNLGGRDVELPDHPLINETIKDALSEALDLDGLTTLLTKIQQGSIKCLAVDTPTPSPFAHEILNANPYAFLDDAPLEERRARAVEMRRMLPQSILSEVGKLDANAIEEVQKQAWPDIRNEDELHDFLQTLIALPRDHQPQDEWDIYFEKLNATGRAAIAVFQNKSIWLASEKLQTFLTVYPEATITRKIKQIATPPLTREDAIITMIRGWISHLGPTSNNKLSELLSIESSEIEQALVRLETTGLILRGNFTATTPNQVEWCERRLLARIHRLTLEKLRKEIAPVTVDEFQQWLLTWQHLTPETQLRGEQGLLEIIHQLQGFEIPANAWEPDILAKRVKDYERTLLDRLCLSGAIGWGRLSPLKSKGKPSKRIRPTSVAPITFFIREESDWMKGKDQATIEESVTSLSHAAKNIYQYLKQKGASFFPDITRNVKNLKSEIETGLWELITAGLVTADDFDNLRALIDPRRRHDKRRRRSQVRFSTGRWSLLYSDDAVDTAQQIEAACWMLLKRYGVVFRDLLTKEKNIPRWRDLLMAYRRLEDRGEIRGGRFVSGFRGEQFALPYAVESLRAIKKKSIAPITLAPCDPISLAIML